MATALTAATPGAHREPTANASTSEARHGEDLVSTYQQYFWAIDGHEIHPDCPACSASTLLYVSSQLSSSLAPKLSSKMSNFNCTVVPSSASTDSGVAGAGVLLSFIATAGISLLMSAIIILHSLRNREAIVIRKLLLSLSDQQIITGIGIQSVALAKMKSMVPYHFFIVWMLSLLSTATHISTLLALVNDFKRDWVLRWLRQFFMFVNLSLSVVSGIFVLMTVMKNLQPTLPIACVWNVESRGAASNAGVSVVGTIAVIAGQCIFFGVGVWYLHIRERKWTTMIQLVGLAVLVAIGVGAGVRVMLLSQAFGTPNLPLSDTGEKDWNFGQLLTLLLLLLPLVSAIEIFRGEITVPPPVDDQEVLLNSEGQKVYGNRASFQPNPFWGVKLNTLG